LTKATTRVASPTTKRIYKSSGFFGEWSDCTRIDGYFVKYYLDQIKKQIRQVTRGATQDNLSLDKLLSFDIIAPPVRLQSKIAGIAVAYDELILNNARRIAILEEMAQAIYREWFVNFRFPGHEKVKLVNSPLGTIPEGWKAVSVEELLTHSTEGITPANSPEEEFAHFSIPNYDKAQLPVLEQGATIQSNKFVVPPGCVLLSKLNPRISRIWLPEPHGDYRCVASTEFLVVSPLLPATREFIYCQFHADEFYGRFRSCSSGTSTSHQRVKPTDFVKLKALRACANSRFLRIMRYEDATL
jgi:type I restriction enzyme S subunit